MGVVELYEEKLKKEKSEGKKTPYYGVKNLYYSSTVEDVAKDIVNRTNNWLKNNSNYVDNYRTRYSGNNETYKKDADDWLSTVTTQNQNFISEANSLKSLLSEYNDYLDPEFVKQITDALDGNLDIQSKIVENVALDRDYWKQWDSEASYNQWHANEKSKQLIMGEDGFEDYYKAGEQQGLGTHKAWFGIDGTKQTIGSDVNDYVIAFRNNRTADGFPVASAIGAGTGSGNAFYASHQRELDAAQYMTDDEYKIYCYYIGKGETAKANGYLISLDDTIAQRKGGAIAQMYKDNNLEWIAWAAVGLDSWASGVKNLDNFIMGTEADPTTAIQYAGSIIREDIDSKFWQGAWDLGVTTSNMLPSILVGSVTGGAGGLATMGASVLGNSYAEMRNLGYNEWQSRGYAALVTAAEVGLQYAIGGITKLGGKLPNGVVEKFASGVDNAIAKIAIRYGGSMASEGFEEALQSVLEPMFKSWVSGEKYDVDWSEVWYSGILGALSAGVLDSVPSVVGGAIEANTIKRQGESFKNNGGDVNRLATYVKEHGDTTFAASSVANRLAGKVNENTNAYQLGLLLNEVGAVVTEQNKADIVRSLEENGIRTKDAKKLADTLAAVAAGYELTAEQKNAFYADEKVSMTMVDVIFNSNSTVNQRIAGYNEAIKMVKAENASKTAEGAKVIDSSAEIETADNTEKESEFTHSIDGKTVLISTGEEVSVKDISSIKKGVVSVQLEDGRKVNAKDISFSSEDEAFMYEMVADLGVTPDTAKFMMDSYNKGKGTVSAQVYRADAPLAYKFGRMEYTKGLAKLELTSEQKLDLFARGKADAEAERKANTAKEDAKVESAKNAQSSENEKNATVSKKEKVAKKKGRIFLEDGSAADIKALKASAKNNDTKREGIATIEFLSTVLSGDYYVFESYENKQGKRVYKDKYGNEVYAPNGYFRAADGSIHIDLNAGELGAGIVLNKLAHEQGHYIKSVDPEGFKLLSDFIVKHYEETGVDVDDLVEKRIKLKRSHRRYEGMSEVEIYDDAFEDIICDGLETIYHDGKVLEMIEALKTTEKGRNVLQKLFDKLKQLINRIVNAYKKVGAETDAGQKAATMSIEKLRELQKIFAEALVRADNIYSSIKGKEGLASEGEQFADRTDIVDVNGREYDHVIELDYKTFNKVKRSGKSYIDFIRNNLINKKITVYNSDGESEVIEFAKANERVQKAGASNKHPVIGELTQARNEIKKLVILNAEETAKISQFDSHKDENSHQWLDENGWDYRTSYVMTKDGTIYPVTLFVAKAQDGRNILYDVNVKIKEGIATDKIATSERSKRNARQAVRLTKPSDALYHKDRDLSRDNNKKFSDREGGEVSEAELSRLREEYSKTRELAKEAKKKLDSIGKYPRYNELVDLVTNKNSSNEVLQEALDAQKKWEQESGYAEAYKEYNSFDQREREARREVDRMEESLSKALREKKYSEEEVQAIVQKAVRKYHTTTRLNKASYLTTTGSMLDFSEGQGYRVKDHREISEILNLPDYAQYSDGMIAFMNMGNIRLQTYGIDISAIPNDRQISALRGIISEIMREYDEFTVDFSKPNGNTDGSVTYPKGVSASKIISDIKSYFETGNIPEYNDSLSQFRYSDRGSTGYELIEKYSHLDLNQDISNMDGVPAIQLTDGSVLPFTETHVWFIKKNDIDVEDIESGGWISNGVYEPTERSDTLRYKEQQLAKRRMEEKRKAKRSETDSAGNTTKDVYSYSSYGEDFYKNSKIYSYDFLTHQKAMAVLKLPALSTIYTDKKIDRGRIVAEGKKNALAQEGSKVGVNGVVYVENIYTNRMIEVNNQSIKHGIGGAKNYTITNARLGMIIGEVIRNGIPINELTPSEGAEATYAMVAYAVSPENKPFLAVAHIDIKSGKLVGYESIDTVHSLRGRIKKGSTAAINSAQGLSEDSLPFVTSEISISQLLEFVNSVQQSILSNDVLSHFNAERSKEGLYYGQTRHSDRDPDLAAKRAKINEILAKENAELREDNEYLKELVKLQRKVTHGAKFTRSSVELVAGRLMKYASAKGNRAELAKLLNVVYEYIAEGNDVTWEGVKEKAQPAIDWLKGHVVNKAAKLDPQASDILKNLKAQRIYIDQDQKSEAAYVFGSVYNFRKRAMGSLTIVDKNNPKGARALESVWHDFADMYPEYFSHEVTAAEMPARLMEIVESLRSFYDTSADYEFAGDMVDQTLLLQIYDGYWGVSTLHTAADTAQKQINLLKHKHHKKMREIRDFHNEKHSQLKQKYQEKITRIKADYRERMAKNTREIITHYQESRARATEGRHKTEMRHKIKKVVDELNKLLLRPTKDKHVQEDLQKAVAESLFVINMDSLGAEERIARINELIAKETNPDTIADLTATRDRISLWGENLKDKLSALQAAYEKIRNSKDVEMVNAYQEVVLNSIKNVSEMVGDTPIRHMSLEQLEAVYEMYTMVLHVVRDSNKAFKAKKGETITQLSESVNDEIRKVSKEKFARNPITALFRKIGWTLLKPLTAFRTIGSETFTDMYKELRNGEDTYFVDIDEAKAFIQGTYKKFNYNEWDKKQTKTFTAKSGKTFTLNLEQMMSIYAYSRREQALAHILEGGIVLEDAVIETKKHGLPIKYQVDTKTAFNISEGTLVEIVNSLTNEQKGFVEEMQAYLSDVMGAKGNEVSMELLGIKLFKEKYYFPLKSSKYYMGFKPEEAGEIKLKNSSFSKETVQHANNPVVLQDFTDVWATHINDMSMYHAFVLPLEDFTRVFNYKTKTDSLTETISTEATIANAYGVGATQYIRDFLKALNGGVRPEKIEGINKAVGLAKKGAVLGSASVIIQQPSAMMRAMALINPIHFVATTHKSLNLVKHKQDWAQLKQYAPIAGIKEMGRFDVGMGQTTVKWIKDQNTVMEKVDDALGKAPAFMDEITWVGIWNAVKKETASKHKDLQVNSEAFLKKAGERFTEVVSLTQVYDSVFSRSDIMRRKSIFVNMLTAFMAEPITTLNMLWDAFIQGKRTGKVGGFIKMTAGAGGAVVGSIVFNAALKSIIMAMKDDDEDESYVEKYFEHFVGGLKDNLNPLTYIPFVKDIVSIFNGYDVERMDMALFSDLKNAIDAFDSDSKTEYEKWSGLVGALSAFFGIPIKNVERDVRGAYNTIKSFIEGERTTGAGIKEAIKEGWTGEKTSNAQQLYEAILSGDQAQIDRVKGRFEDQDAINAAIIKALRENDSRIKQAAKDHRNGNLRGYSDYIDTIVAEGHFDADIVKSAILAEEKAFNNKINNAAEAKARGDDEEYKKIIRELRESYRGIYSQDEIVNLVKKAQNEQLVTDDDEDTHEVTSKYSTSDVNIAFESGDTAMAKEVITDLVNTKMANGKTEKEAKASIRSSMTAYWKPLYKAAYQNNDTAETERIRKILYASGLYGGVNDVIETAKSWLKD